MVALVKVNNHFIYTNEKNKLVPMSIEVEIIDVYRGKEDRKNVVVWGNAGNMCRPDVSQFHQDGYYVMALDATGGNPLYDEPDSDYALSACGEYWLSVENVDAQMATGKISEDMGSISLEQLKKTLIDK